MSGVMTDRNGKVTVAEDKPRAICKDNGAPDWLISSAYGPAPGEIIGIPQEKITVR